MVKLVFPIRGKILKSGFRVTEKKTEEPVFFGFQIYVILRDKNSISFWNYYCWSLRSLLANFWLS